MFKNGLILYVCAYLLLSGCAMGSKTETIMPVVQEVALRVAEKKVPNWGMVSSISPVDELISPSFEQTELYGIPEKDAGAKQIRWFIIILTTITVTTLTIFTIQANQREADIPDYPYIP